MTEATAPDAETATATAASRPGAAVARRRVFFIPGYDPFHPRRYRELYRKESAAQAAVSGHAIAQRPRQAPGAHGWNVTATIEGRTTETGIEVLVWADLVRVSMDAGVVATYVQLVRTAWVYLCSGAFPRLMRLRKGPALAALYPVAMLLGQLALALAFGRLVGAGAVALLPGAGGTALAWGAGGGTVWAILAGFRRQDRHLFAHYLMHDYAFTAQDGGAYPAELEARLAAFRATIAEALDSDVDEVLVVGHSSGAYLAVSVLADLLRAGQGPGPGGPALGLLTLGQVVPMAAFLPRADRLRGDLRLLSQSDRLAWVDVTAPGDGCAFALCDPVAVSGAAGPGKRWPLVISAAFTQTLSPERWKALRWRFFRLHFQYLCAFDRPGDYDYFAITAGPCTLADRFAGRAPSRSRIERNASGFDAAA